MGSVRANIRVSSSDVLATAVDISSAITLTADSGNINRVKIVATSAGGTAQIIHKANEKLNRAYI